MSRALFSEPVELSPELIEQHVRSAQRLRSESFGRAVAALVRWVRHWLHRPQQGRLAASVS